MAGSTLLLLWSRRSATATPTRPQPDPFQSQWSIETDCEPFLAQWSAEQSDETVAPEPAASQWNIE